MHCYGHSKKQYAVTISNFPNSFELADAGKHYQAPRLFLQLQPWCEMAGAADEQQLLPWCALGGRSLQKDQLEVQKLPAAPEGGDHRRDWPEEQKYHVQA